MERSIEPDDNLDGVDEDALIEAEETGYEDIETDSNDYFDKEDW